MKIQINDEFYLSKLDDRNFCLYQTLIYPEGTKQAGEKHEEIISYNITMKAAYNSAVRRLPMYADSLSELRQIVLDLKALEI